MEDPPPECYALTVHLPHENFVPAYVLYHWPNFVIISWKENREIRSIAENYLLIIFRSCISRGL